MLEATKLVRTGTVISLAHAEPQMAAADVNPNGVFKRTTNNSPQGGTSDNYQVSYHGLTSRTWTLVPLLRERPDVQRHPPWRGT